MAAVASHSFRIKYGWYLQALFKEWSGTNTLVRASNLFHLSSPLSSYATFCNDAPPPDGTITTSCCDHSIDRGPSPWFPHLQERDTEIGSLQDSKPFYWRLPRFPPTLHGSVLSPCQRSRGRKRTCTSVSAIRNLLI